MNLGTQKGLIKSIKERRCWTTSAETELMSHDIGIIPGPWWHRASLDAGIGHKPKQKRQPSSIEHRDWPTT